MIPHNRTFIRGRLRTVPTPPGSSPSSPTTSPPTSPSQDFTKSTTAFDALPPLLTNLTDNTHGTGENSATSPTTYDAISPESSLPNTLVNSTSTSASSPSSDNYKSHFASHNNINNNNAFGIPFSYSDLPDPTSFGDPSTYSIREPTLSFMTSSTGAESSTISTARNSDIDPSDGGSGGGGGGGGIPGPRIVRPRGSVGGSSSGVGSPIVGYGESGGGGMVGIIPNRLSMVMDKGGNGNGIGFGMGIGEGGNYSKMLGMPLDILKRDMEKSGGDRDSGTDMGMETEEGEELEEQMDEGDRAGYGYVLESPGGHERSDSEGGRRPSMPQRTSYISNGSRRIVSERSIPEVPVTEPDWTGARTRIRPRPTQVSGYPTEYGDEVMRNGSPRRELPTSPSYGSMAPASSANENAEAESSSLKKRPSFVAGLASSRTVESLKSLHKRHSRSGTISSVASVGSESEEGYGSPVDPSNAFFSRPSPLSRSNSTQLSPTALSKPWERESSPALSIDRPLSYSQGSRGPSRKSSLSNLPRDDRDRDRHPGISPVLPFYQNSAFEYDFTDTSFGSEAETDDRPPKSVALDDDGKSKVVDAERIAGWGGAAVLKSRLQNEVNGAYDGGVLGDFSDTTHIVLSTLTFSEDLLGLLEVLLPLIPSSLVVLDISNNMLERLPISLAKCHALEELNVSSNPVISLPSWFGNLRSLRVLMAESCGLKSLPMELGGISGLHTICVRRNRLISLPSWLSQLAKLETLYVDDNPFSGQWKTLVASILTKPDNNQASNLRSQSPFGGASAFTTSPAPSPGGLRTQSPLPSSLDSPLPNSPFATTPTWAYGSSDSSLGVPANPSETLPPRGKSPAPSAHRALSRMRSAGTLLGIGSSEDNAPPTATNGSFARHRVTESRHEVSLAFRSDTSGSQADSSGSKSRQSSFGEPVPAKSAKWGFLRKMSMNKLRSSGQSTTIRPPMPTHTTSDPTQIPKLPSARPPAKTMAHSAMTLPTMQLLRDDSSASEFGAKSDKLGTSGLPSPTWATMDQARGKRRSYLPIDRPPKLNITIPLSTSPLFPATATAIKLPPVPADRLASSGAHLLQTAFPGSVEEGRDHLSVPSANAPERKMNYDVGLKSIMSYLADLYDLSLPVPVFQGGAEIVHNDTSVGSESLSDIRSASPSPQVMSQSRFPSMSSAARSRRPTLEVTPDSKSSATSENRLESCPEGARISLPARPDLVDTSAGKRYKDDSSVRTGVVKHIIETERTYVAGLRDLIDIYVKPATAKVGSKSSETMIPSNEAKIVFGGIEGIYRFHHDSFLPALESAAKELMRSGDDATGERSKKVARAVGDVFKLYHPFMRQYSSYINNFDFALARLASWTASTTGGSIGSTATGGSGASGVASVAVVAGLGLPGSASSTPSEGVTQPTLNPVQRKRIKTFLKECRKSPRHSQLNVESYLLLPVQRIPRYRMLLNDLARSTEPTNDVNQDPIEIALQEMEGLASMMNEEKRDSESRRRLVQWQSRIRGRFATPLVRAHRRLLLDGQLTATRTVRRVANFVEVPRSVLHSGMSSPPDVAGGIASGSVTPLTEDDEDGDSNDDKDDKEHTITGLNSTLALENGPAGDAARNRRRGYPALSALTTSTPGSPKAFGTSPMPGSPASHQRDSAASTGDTTIVQIEALEPEVRDMRLSVILTSDLVVLCREVAPSASTTDPSTEGSTNRSTGGRPNTATSMASEFGGRKPNGRLETPTSQGDGTGQGQTGMMDLVAVLKLQTKSRPAMVVQGNVIRLVDNRCIWYFSAKSPAEAARWVRTINDEFEPVR